MGILLYIALMADEIKEKFGIVSIAILSMASTVCVVFLIGMLANYPTNNPGLKIPEEFYAWRNGLITFITHSLIITIPCLIFFILSAILPTTKNCFILFGVTSFVKKEHLEKANELTRAALDLLIKKIKDNTK